jgi:hypothetical protein
MNIYKCRVTFNIVVEGNDEEEAKEAIDKLMYIDGLDPDIGTISRVTKIEQLPDGWTGSELAFSKWEYSHNEQSIRYWLEHQR